MLVGGYTVWDSFDPLILDGDGTQGYAGTATGAVMGDEEDACCVTAAEIASSLVAVLHSVVDDIIEEDGVAGGVE